MELADFEKMSSGPELSVEDLIRDAGLNGGRDIMHCYVVETKQAGKTGMIPVGYSICFISYSTWQGKAYFMEDLYIKPEFRGQGAGTTLFQTVAHNAKILDCKRLDFHVLSWNPAKKFYEKMGADNLTELENWHFYRLQGEALDKFTITT